MNNETMTNEKGHLVPMALVKAEHKLENDLVLDLFDKARRMNAEIARFKITATDDIEAFLALVGEKYGVRKGGQKGNITLLSYDGLTKVQVAVAESIAFGPQLQVAKTLVDEFIKESIEGVNENICALVNHAFAVDREGKVNRSNILSLRRLDIKAEKWKQAMAAIADSMRVTSTKQYIRFYQRRDPVAPWVAMPLDFAAV
ncbi:MAG: DUF3164 family protein [Alphaproteobacteria bacterium]|nr:DUF3164 family protein [Alphaproteobacteria bacterium]